MRELKSVLPYFRPYRTGVVLGVICVVLANAFQIAGPWFMKLGIDAMGEPGVTRGTIAFYAFMVVAVAGIGGVFRFGMRQYLNGISRRIETDLRDDFFQHLLRLDASFYGTTRTGDLMSRATNDTLAVRMAAGPAVMYTVNTAASFVFALGFMLVISPRLTVYAMVPMIVLPPIVLFFGRIIHRRFEEIQEQFSSLSTFVQENLTGVRLVRAYTQEDEQARQFDRYNEDYRRRNMRLVMTAGAFHPLLMLISGLALVVVTGLGAIEVMANTITIGDFVAFTFYLTLLIWPMIALGWVVNLYQRGAASMGRLNRILDAEPAVPTPAIPASLADARGAVEFRNVSFVYPGTERAVLEDLSFSVPAGQTVAIMGPTGAGKSTVIALLARLYDPTAGRILIDGIPLTEVDPAELRARIGMVPQDPFLFSDTIKHNIGFESPEDTMRASARVAQLHDQILEFPRGYDTMLGERGINLSGGQKQRATLARALARDPLLLILDDALSAVDTHTETAILDDLRVETGRRTSFIISHRGRIVESGRHAELVEADGTYARLVRRQLLEESLAAGD
jgi:ATP-binding cassette subfamily B protein